MPCLEKDQPPCISRRAFLNSFLIGGGVGALGALLTKDFRLGRPDRVGLLNPEDVSSAVRGLGLPVVNFFLDNGLIRNSIITKPIFQADTGTLFFNSDMSVNNNPGPGIQLTGGYNRNTNYNLSFGLPNNVYESIVAADGNRNVAISDNLTVLSMSIIGGRGLAIDNELLLYGRDWTEISTHHLLYGTTDPKKIAREPKQYRALTVPDLIQFYSDIAQTLTAF